MNTGEFKEGQGQESNAFIEALGGITTYVELEEFLKQDGKERGYNGRALAKDIWAAVLYKPKTEQSALRELDSVAREQLMAAFRHMDDREADALIEKVAWLIETDPQRAEDKEENRRIAAMANKIKLAKAEDAGKSEEEIEKLKQELEERFRAQWGEESIKPPPQTQSEALKKKPWWKFWG